MKSTQYLFTLLIIAVTTSCVFAAQLSCASDADCNFGLCTPSGNSSFCSCLSGFGGANCLTRPSSNCTVQNVTSESTNFEPFVILTYYYPSEVGLDVTVPVEESIFEKPSVGSANNTVPYSLQTTIYFGNGSFPECSFPNARWRDLAATSNDCVDRYRLNISFADAVAKCGFSDSLENRTYEQTITVERKYLVMESRGFNLTRTDSRAFTLKIIFPEGANVSTPNIRVSYTASSSPSATASGSPPPLPTFSVVTMSIASTLEDFSPSQFVEDIAGILNITSDRITITGITISDSKALLKRVSTITVTFKIIDQPGSSAANLATTLVELVESNDPVFADYGLTVTGITVDNSNAGGQASSSEQDSHHGNNNILLFAVLIPGIFLVLTSAVIASLLIAKRLRNQRDKPSMPEAPSPDRTPGISPTPSYSDVVSSSYDPSSSDSASSGSPSYHPGSPSSHPGSPSYHPGSPSSHPGSPSSHPGYPSYHPGSPASHPAPPPAPELREIPTSKRQGVENKPVPYPERFTPTTRIKSRQVTLQLMDQLKLMKEQTQAGRATKNNVSNNNNKASNNNNNTKEKQEDTQPISRPPSYTTALYDPHTLAVQPSAIKRANTRMSQGPALKTSQTKGAALKPSQTKMSKAPPKPVKEDSDSDSSWIATPDSLTSDSDEQ